MAMGYVNAFVTLSPDCPALAGTVPERPASIAGLEHALLTSHPYRYAALELILEVHRRHKGVEDVHLDAFRAWLFARSQPCMRLSMLPKRWGWGVHYDEQGRIALYGAETDGYRRLAARPDLRVMQARASRRVASVGARSIGL